MPEPLGVQIELPYNWRPRDYQMPLWAAMEGGCKRAVAIWHRRAGKDLFGLNWTMRSMMLRRGAYWHVAPTYAQGRKIVWEGMTGDGRPFLDYIPRQLIKRSRDDTMQLWLENGSTWQVIGADEPDRLVGPNPVGIVFTEYSVQNPAMWNFMRPILAENGGWALFLYTPRGRNHGWTLYRNALKQERWFAQVLTVDDTHSISASAIDDDRATGMPEEEIQQEYWCSFNAALVGSYLGKLISEAETAGRIREVPYEPGLPVLTAWDLGMSDALAIWMYQKAGAERRIIDFEMGAGHGLDHYVKLLQQRPYVFGQATVPHDAKVRELGTGKSRIQVLNALGVRTKVLPKYTFNDGLNAMRQLIPTCYFDEQRCALGLSGLREWRKKKLEGQEGPHGEPVYADEPLHNWASNVADAFRYLALGDRAHTFPGQGRSGDVRRLDPRLAIV